VKSTSQDAEWPKHDKVCDHSRLRAEANMYMQFHMDAYMGGPSCDRSGSSLLKFNSFPYVNACLFRTTFPRELCVLNKLLVRLEVAHFLPSPKQK